MSQLSPNKLSTWSWNNFIWQVEKLVDIGNATETNWRPTWISVRWSTLATHIVVHMGFANFELRRITLEAKKIKWQNNREQDNEAAVCVWQCIVFSRIILYRSAIGLYTSTATLHSPSSSLIIITTAILIFIYSSSSAMIQVIIDILICKRLPGRSNFIRMEFFQLITTSASANQLNSWALKNSFHLP